MDRKEVDIKSVMKINIMPCINKTLLKLDDNYPNDLFIKYKLSPHLEDYINYTLYKKKNGNAIYQSTIFRDKIFIFNDKEICNEI